MERFARIMAVSPHFKHADAPLGTYECRVEFLKSVMVMSVYTPFIFYAIPFVVAAGVLIRALIEKLRPTPNVDEKPVFTDDDPMLEELRSRPIQRPYISYSVC